jgi:hypothetical protein
MRGLFSLLTRGRNSSDYKTGIFVASSDPDVTTLALAKVNEQLSHLSFAFVAPRLYAKMLPKQRELIALDTIKAQVPRSVVQLRARRFDLCVVLLPGRPSFSKAKLLAFLLNTRRIFVFNEHNEFIPLDASHLSYLPWHLTLRLWRRAKKILVPFGIPYLVYQALKLKLRARRYGVKARSGQAADVSLR